MIFEFGVEVGVCVARPPRPENIRLAWVRVIAASDTEAHLLAAQMVASLDVCVMPTHTTIMEVREC